MSYVRDFSQARLRDAEQAVGKGANLGELIRADLPVPPGFVVKREAYLASMERGGVRAELAKALTAVDDSDQQAESSKRMREPVTKAVLSPQVRDAILAAYRGLGPDVDRGRRNCSPGWSAAGLHCSALFGQRVVAYRASRGRQLGPASPSTWCGWGSRRSRSTRTWQFTRATRSPQPSGACCSTPRLLRTTTEE
jgi:pyruvate,water dikinase